MKNTPFACVLLLLPILGIEAASEPLGTPDRKTIEYPDGAPPSAAEIALGTQLYFDNRLSGNQAESCASCHNPDLGMGDGLARGQGSRGNQLGRNTPHIYNLAWSTVFFWDGRAKSLEQQALGPIQSEGEMNMPLDDVVKRLQGVAGYREEFAKVYGPGGVTAENIGKAIAAFERTVISDHSAFDRFIAGDAAAMSAEAQRGLALFKGKANCIACHSGPNFTDDSFHNLGLGDADPGRAKIVKGPGMEGAFKTPGLRNVALTGPYMHNGSLSSLEAVVRFYNQGGLKPSGDPLVKPLALGEGEIRDLVAFLGALTDPVKISAPVLP